MKTFLKPTKITWIVFIVLLIINVPLYFFTALQAWRSLWYAIILQILWLYAVFGAIGLDVTGRGDYIKAPNFLGLMSIVIGSFVTLIIYYVLASVIVHIISRRDI